MTTKRNYVERSKYQDRSHNVTTRGKYEHLNLEIYFSPFLLKNHNIYYENANLNLVYIEHTLTVLLDFTFTRILRQYLFGSKDADCLRQVFSRVGFVINVEYCTFHQVVHSSTYSSTKIFSVSEIISAGKQRVCAELQPLSAANFSKICKVLFLQLQWNEGSANELRWLLKNDP